MLRLFCLALLITGSASAQTRATTDDGRTVWLHDDGTWSSTPPDEIVADFDAIETGAPPSPAPSPAPPPPPMPPRTITGGGGVYEVRYDASRWKRAEGLADGAEHGFQLPYGAGYAAIIYEVTQFPPSAMREIILENARVGTGSDVEVVSEQALSEGRYRIEYRLSPAAGADVTMINTIHSSAEGSIQVVTWTATSVLERFRDELERFQSGVRFVSAGG